MAALQGASNRLINVEDLTETEIRLLHEHYQRLVAMAKRDVSLTESHSVEEADQRHRAKARLAKPATGHARAEGGPRRRASNRERRADQPVFTGGPAASSGSGG